MSHKLIPNLTKKKTGTFSDSFSAGLSPRWQTTNNAWSVTAEAAVATPTLESELFTNGSFATDTNWTKDSGWTISAGQANHSTTTGNITQNVGTAGKWIKQVASIKSISGASASVSFIFGLNAQTGVSKTTAADNQVSINYRATGSLQGFRAGSTTTCVLDDASAKELTTSDLFCTVGGLNNKANISVNMQFSADNPAGLVGWLDDYQNPANYILIYHTGAAVRMLKVVAGAITQLFSSTISQSAGAPLLMKGTRSGNSLILDATYNGVTVGTQQTVSDAGIVGNRRHGMFSTSNLNSLDSFAVTAYA